MYMYALFIFQEYAREIRPLRCLLLLLLWPRPFRLYS
jgi:hypothetical protein